MSKHYEAHPEYAELGIFAGYGEFDCIYPDCLIKTAFGKTCEHSCPYEERKRKFAAQDALYNETMQTP